MKEIQKEILEKVIEEHEAEVWEFYKDDYWSKDDFRFEPENGADCIEGFRKWDFDQYMNGAYHYGFVLGIRTAMTRLSMFQDMSLNKLCAEFEKMEKRIGELYDN
tara:strand:+ start:380 stop:694 length:315 start_codon:yes stop_codon:yes gene_type:complete